MKKRQEVVCPVNTISHEELFLVEIHFNSGTVERFNFPEDAYEQLTQAFLNETDDSSISIEIYPENIKGNCIHTDNSFFLYIDTSKIEYIK